MERLSKICSILGFGISLFAGNALAEPWGAGITPVYAPDFEPGSVQAVKLTECKVSANMVCRVALVAAEWHGYRHRYVYRVETSGYSVPY